MTDIKRSETAYHGRRDRKARFLKEQRAYLKADRFKRGSTGDYQTNNDGDAIPGTFQGCGIACSVYSIKRIKRECVIQIDLAARPGFYDHQLIVNYLGVKRDIVDAFETVFEALCAGEESKFAIQFALALKPGSQPTFSLGEYDRFTYCMTGEQQRDFLLNLLRTAKPVVEAR